MAFASVVRNSGKDAPDFGVVILKRLSSVSAGHPEDKMTGDHGLLWRCGIRVLVRRVR